MATLSNVIMLNYDQYDTLMSSGSVTVNGTTYTYDSNNVYVINEDVWHTVSINNTGISIPFRDNGSYQIELFGGGQTYSSFIDLGIINFMPSGTSSTHPIIAAGIDCRGSLTSGGWLIRFEAYRTAINTWSVTLYFSTNMTSYSTLTGYNLRYRRVNI